MIKKSFTMIEMIFVILIVSIIAVVVSPKFCGDACGKNSDLVKAANQILSHIRYTRHLAMIDNKFVPNPNLSSYSNNNQKEKDSKFWFKKWWEIYFYNENTPDWHYAVFSDLPTTFNSTNKFNTYPNNKEEVAMSPLKKDKYMVGNDYRGAFGNDYSEDMNLTKKFSISNITIDKCSNHILFDNFGRPHCSKSETTEPYYSSLNPYDKIITSTAKITLTHENGDTIDICVEAETGYSYICD